MSGKRDKYIPKVFESESSFLEPKKDGSKAKDVSANIYISMLQSRAWHNLTGKQKELYLYCKAQYFGEKKTKKQHTTTLEEINGEKPDLSKRFTMNRSKWCECYGLYTENTQKYFYKDIKALQDNGFIKTLESGKTTRTKNIYEFSDKWRELGKQKNT